VYAQGDINVPTRLREEPKLLKQLMERYKDEHKALIANALVLWSGQPVKIIKRFMEGESQALFIEILKDLRGPIFYYRENDEIVLRRWVKVLLAEGKESKQLTAAEEKDAFEFARDIQTKYHNSFVTPKDLRDLLDLGDTKSSHVMSSKLLKKWQSEGKVKGIRRGLYQFKKQVGTLSIDLLLSKLGLDDINSK